MDFCIRVAKPEDYDSVEAIMQEVHQMHVAWRPDIYRNTDVVFERAYYEELVEAHQLWVAEQADGVVGLLNFQYRHITSNKQVTRTTIFVDDFVVKEGYRGQGIGTRLLEKIKEKVRRERLDGLELQVNARNLAARSMYERFGFTEKSINMELL